MSTREPGAGEDGSSQDLARHGGVVGSMTLVSRIAGFVRDMVLSNFFGATAVADAFFVAFRIPNFFRRLFAEGAFSQAFVPVLATYRAGNDRAALLRFVRALLGSFGLALTLVCMLGVIGAPVLVAVFAPGFADDPSQRALASDMVRVTFPYLGFISLTAFAGALLNSHHRYALPAFTPVLLNVVLICAALWLTRWFDPPVMGLAWGVFIAGALQLAIQLPAVRSLGMPLLPRLERRHEGVRNVGRLIVPAVFGASASQINTLVDTVLASLLQVGSISWLYYSDRLMELPIGTVAVAIGTVLLPSLSRQHALGDSRAMSRSLDWGVRMGVMFAAPAGVALHLLAVPLIATIFYHGAMTAQSVVMAALSLQTFAVGTLGFVLAKIAAPGYFARLDTTTPFRIALVSVGVNLLVSLSVFSFFGHVGLALATSTAAIVQSYLLLRGLIVRGVYRPEPELGRFVGKVIVGILAMAVVVGWLAAPADAWLEMSATRRALELTIVCASGLAAYAAALVAMGVRPSMLRHRV